MICEHVNGAASVGTWGNFDTDASQFDEIDYYVLVPLNSNTDFPVSVDFIYTEHTFPGSDADADRKVGLLFDSNLIVETDSRVLSVGEEVVGTIGFSF